MAVTCGPSFPSWRVGRDAAGIVVDDLCGVVFATMMGISMMAVHLEIRPAEFTFIHSRGQHILQSGGPFSGRKYDVRLSKRRAFWQVICKKVEHYCFRHRQILPQRADSVE